MFWHVAHDIEDPRTAMDIRPRDAALIAVRVAPAAGRSRERRAVAGIVAIAHCGGRKHHGSTRAHRVRQPAINTATQAG